MNSNFSTLVSRSLDCLGYGQIMVKNRICVQDKRDSNVTMSSCRKVCNMARVTAGSKAEGITAPCESDSDFMLVPKGIVCTTADTTHYFTYFQMLTVFQTDRWETSPGYTQLKLVQLNGTSAIQGMNLYYLSSELVMQQLETLNKEAAERNLFANVAPLQVYRRSGPSTPSKGAGFLYDTTVALKCFCPDLLYSWMTRVRHHDWPHLHLREAVSLMTAHVVPVGFKGSETFYQEWRICFTCAEVHLIRNFNDTQRKLYILMKMVLKSIIKPVCQEMTSYIMKNIVLWMSELKPFAHFREELLIQLLVQSLQFLKICVMGNFLPNYMIHERNLLAGRLDSIHRYQLAYLLSDLINEGGSLLLRCERLGATISLMYTSPRLVIAYGTWRDVVESLFLLRYCVARKMLDDQNTNRELTDAHSRLLYMLFNIVLPEWGQLHRRGINIAQVCNARLHSILSLRVSLTSYFSPPTFGDGSKIIAHKNLSCVNRLGISFIENA